MASIRVALCQINPTVGDLTGNSHMIIEAITKATDSGADLAIFPELATTGYPPEDLLLKPRFVADNLDALDRIAEATTSCAAIVGFVDRGLDLHNAAAVCHAGQIVGRYHKRVLPNYGVFDEQRYFAAGTSTPVLFRIAGVKVGVSICEDAWAPNGPIAEQASGGAELMVSINASPYFAGKVVIREQMMSTRADDASIPIVYVNQVGGQDELVFDGASMVVDARGRITARASQFVEEVMFVDLDVQPTLRKRSPDPRGRMSVEPFVVSDVSDASTRSVEVQSSSTEVPRLERIAEIYSALVLGTRDYIMKNGFTDVVLGLSGGVDSALVATVAVDAIGAGGVHAISMPSRYSSEGSRSDAQQLAQNLGIELRTAAIDAPHEVMEQMLGLLFESELAGITDENLQSRLRGLTLMAASNQYGWLVLTTGNKSELAVGYSTLYGDTAGGFAVIKDVAKTVVYELCHWRNSTDAVIPHEILDKAPSAELRPEQRDDDSLPPYELLDPILEAYIEDDLTAGEIQRLGYDPELVRSIVERVDVAEYKRRQSPLGVRVTPKAFGKDRRVPITNAYRG